MDCSNSSDINFTNTRPGCIEGFKLNYTDGKGLEGWTIEVRNSTTGDLAGSSTTDEIGFWQVCNLVNGTYTVCEVKQSGWIQTSPEDCYTVTMEGINVTGKNFTNVKTLCLSGFKFQNSTGEPLGGWTIVVTNETASFTAVTDEHGLWQVCNLTPGDYKVCEVLQPGWIQVSPKGCYDVSLQDLSNSSLNFYNDPSDLCLSGHKFHHRTGEGLEGWTIEIRNTSGWIGTAQTDGTGFWQLCNLTPGDYTVCEVLQSGWIQARPVGCYNRTLVNESISNLDFYNDPSCNLTLTKTTDKATAKRGEDITYNITLTNPCAYQGYCFTNTTLWDQLPNGVEVVSVSPAPLPHRGAFSTGT